MELTSKQFKGRNYSRQKVRIRDNHTCQNCKKVWEEGKSNRFDVHHLSGLCGKGRDFDYDTVKDLSNLVTLCHPCHMGLHTVRAKISLGRIAQLMEERGIDWVKMNHGELYQQLVSKTANNVIKSA